MFEGISEASAAKKKEIGTTIYGFFSKKYSDSQCC
jgi:hypothetical protein